MSLKSPDNMNSLEVTGNFLEPPPNREPSIRLDNKNKLIVATLNHKSAHKQRQSLVQMTRSISNTRIAIQQQPESARLKKSNDLKSSTEMLINREHQIKSYDIYLVT